MKDKHGRELIAMVGGAGNIVILATELKAYERRGYLPVMDKPARKPRVARKRDTSKDGGK